MIHIKIEYHPLTLKIGENTYTFYVDLSFNDIENIVQSKNDYDVVLSKLISKQIRESNTNSDLSFEIILKNKELLFPQYLSVVSQLIFEKNETCGTAEEFFEKLRSRQKDLSEQLLKNVGLKEEVLPTIQPNVFSKIDLSKSFFEAESFERKQKYKEQQNVEKTAENTDILLNCIERVSRKEKKILGRIQRLQFGRLFLQYFH